MWSSQALEGGRRARWWTHLIGATCKLWIRWRQQCAPQPTVLYPVGGELNSIDCVMGQYGISISGEGIIASIRLSIKVAFSLCGVGGVQHRPFFDLNRFCLLTPVLVFWLLGRCCATQTKTMQPGMGCLWGDFALQACKSGGVSLGDVINREVGLLLWEEWISVNSRLEIQEFTR